MSICPHCGKEMFRVYFGDNIYRVRYTCHDIIYSDKVYYLTPGDMPVRKREDD